MTKTTAKQEDSQASESSHSIQPPGRELPTLYADNLAGLSIGPFICKITLATEAMPGQLSPSMHLSMPTNVLHGLAKTLMGIFSDPNTHQQFETIFAETIKNMKAVD